MMMSLMKLICWPILCLAFLPHISCAIVDALPSEYPYAVKFALPPSSGKPRTGVALAVSDRYFLSRGFQIDNIVGSLLTDQNGVTYTVVKFVNISGNFAYEKVCKKFKGPKFPLTASSFNDFSAPVPNAELIFFKDESYVLQKKTVSIKSRSACAQELFLSVASLKVACVELDTSNNNEICTIYGDTGSTYYRYPMMAVAGQAHGVYIYTDGCSSGVSSSTANYELFSEYLVEIIAGIPDTVIS